MSEREYRIEYTIVASDDEWESQHEIGFGSSGGWHDVDSAAYAVGSDIQNRSWETEADMPDPRDVDREPGDSEFPTTPVSMRVCLDESPNSGDAR
jgi:hypothetical protein